MQRLRINRVARISARILALSAIFGIGALVGYACGFHEGRLPATPYSCRSPADSGERLTVTIRQRDDGTLVEDCVYAPVSKRHTSRNLHDWRTSL